MCYTLIECGTCYNDFIFGLKRFMNSNIIHIPKNENDDHLYISPTSNDTLEERYPKIISRSDDELIKALRTPTPFFSDEEDNEVEND